MREDRGVSEWLDSEMESCFMTFSDILLPIPLLPSTLDLADRSLFFSCSSSPCVFFSQEALKEDPL